MDVDESTESSARVSELILCPLGIIFCLKPTFLLRYFGIIIPDRSGGPAFIADLGHSRIQPRGVHE